MHAAKTVNLSVELRRRGKTGFTTYIAEDVDE
jgi:hypothetical protein